MLDEKYLIVNADDFGQSPGINRGIIEAHERGIVTSASLMTRWLAAGEAALYARRHPRLSVGLHFDLGEWRYQEGDWKPIYTVAPLEDKSAVECELLHQLDTFRCLLGKNPSHINSHQHVHMREPVRSVALAVCDRLGIPLREFSPEIHYSMKFYGQTKEGLPFPVGIGREWLTDLLSNLPLGLSVLVCHPGEAADLRTSYQSERHEELKILCDLRIRAAIEELNIKLCTFDEHKQFNVAGLISAQS